ncbi:hypothetical protein Q1695_007006 [Nippostrongylus brasiliensis]|nr:hypothetical protein Q1695_007006 [Nippostrongylus brasiliensis]
MIRDVESLKGNQLTFKLPKITRYRIQHGDILALRAVKMWRRLCGSSAQCEIVPPFELFGPVYVIAGPPFRISTCLIPKNMSSVLINIFCSVFKNLVGKTNETVTTMKKNTCRKHNHYMHLEQIRRISRHGPWMNFAFVREPAERFLSAYLHICTHPEFGRQDCEGCFGDMKCALKKAFVYSQRFVSGLKRVRSHLYWHISPQNWWVLLLSKCLTLTAFKLSSSLRSLCCHAVIVGTQTVGA